MAFDVNRTVALVKGGLLNAEPTWKTYLEENPTWQQTAMVLTVPLLIVNVVLTVIFSKLMGGYSAYGYQSNWFIALLMGLVLGALGIIVATFVFNFLAGLFKGTSNFSRAFAAISLAAIPAWVAGTIAPLIPFLGFFLALAGGILSLVYMYRLMPLALNVPQEKRVLHFIASLVVIIIVNMLISTVLGLNGSVGDNDYITGESDSRSPATSGVLGEFARQGELMQAAGEDTYSPPADGELSEDQVKTYVSVLEKTRSIQAEHAQKIQKLSDDMEADQTAGKNVSLADISKAYSGVGSVVSASNAEMEVVKSGGGNWAEHQWVKQQLRTARYQQGDGSDAISHNYALYQEYEEVLNE